MNRVLADTKAFGTQYLRARTGAFFAFIFPLILVVLFGLIFSGNGNSKITLYVQDLDDSATSHSFVSALNNTTVVTYQQIPKGVAIDDYIHANSVNLALRIPVGFQNNVSRAAQGDRNASVNVTLYGDPTQSSHGIAVSIVSGVATQFNFQIAGTRPVVGLATQTVSVRQLEFIDLFLPGVIGLTILTNPLFGMTNTCAEYRTRKYFKFLATTTLTKAQWLTAKMIFYTIIMLASVGVMMIVNALLFHGKATLTPMAVLLIIAGTFEFTSLGMILGLFVKDVETANAVANGIGFPMMFLGGSFFPIDTMPTYLQAVARALPLTYLNEGLRATMVFGNEGTAVLYLGITLAVAIVFFLIPAKALSWKSK